MTLDDIKQELREVKMVCSICLSCEDCLISNEKGECQMVDPDLTIVYPLDWPLDWKEDEPS